MTTSFISYSPESPEIVELKAFVRYRFRLVSRRTRLVIILFPELPGAVSTIPQTSAYTLFLELLTKKDISECHLTKPTNLLSQSSKHRHGREKSVKIKALAQKSIGTKSIAVGFELQQTIRLIRNLYEELSILDKHIKNLMLEINSPILTILGISFTLGSILLAEIGNIENFDNPSKLLAFAGLEPSIHQSGDLRLVLFHS